MHNGYNNGFPIEGCAPGPDYVNPYSELARRDPIVAIAIEQARETGEATAASRYAHTEVRNLSDKLKVTTEKLDRANRENVYVQNDLDNAYEERDELEVKVAKLEKKVKPAKKVVKKAKKVSKK